MSRVCLAAAVVVLLIGAAAPASAGPPSATTSPASSIGTTTVTLNGLGNPNGEAATGWFRYAFASPGTCNDSFGTRAPSSGGAALGSGSSPVSYSQGIVGLIPGASYYFCAIVANGSGTSFGAVLTFSAATGGPTVTTSAASLITAATATLNGSANPNGDATTGWFRYDSADPGACDDGFGTRAPSSGGAALGSGTSPVSYGQEIAGLLPLTTYYYCAIAENSSDLGFGAVLSFTTAGPPTATTAAATVVTSSTATLNGSGNPNGEATTGWFRYSTTSPGTCNDSFGTRAPASGGAALGAGGSAVPYSEPISGLAASTTFYFCAIAANSNGTGFGAVLSFTTNSAAPIVTTAAATAVTSATATLNGSANPNGDATTGWFRYSTTSPGTCNDSFGTRAPASGGSALGAGGSAMPYSEPISGLAPSATLYFCAIAANSNGTGFGAITSFSTGPTVVGFATVADTGDGLLAEGERTIGGVTQLLVQFSGAMADPPGNTASEDVTNPANYRLFAAGPNGQLETASCGAPAGDDVTIVVAGVDYAAAPFLAALSFSSPFALDEESYRLAVCATLQDPAGHALEAASRTFYILGSDRLAQPNFDDDLAGWTISDPVPGALQWSSSDAGAAATSGAAEIVTAVGAGQAWLLWQCIELPERRFLGRVRARIQSLTAGAPVVRMAIEHLAGEGCTGAALGVVLSPAIAGDSANLWATSAVSGTVPTGAQSVLVTARVDGAAASTFTATLDDLFYGDPVTLFVDGFESGGLARWSLAAP